MIAAPKKKRSAKLLAARAKARREGWLGQVRSEADERAMLDGCWFDAERARHVVEFGPQFLILQGAYHGKPFELTDWQREQLFEPLFGWVRASDEWGRVVRRYRTAYVEEPKKQGKSPQGAYVASYMLAGDGPNTWGAECYSASTDKEQATIVWGAAANMVEASPELQQILAVNRTTKTISRPGRASFYRVLSSCPRRNEGWNAQLIVVDELHKWYGRDLWDALQWAFASRPEPLLFAITTAGDDTESVCYEQHEYTKACLDGRHYDPSHFGLIYAAEPDDDPHSPETWRRANPALGQHLKLSTFRTDYERAKAQGVGAFEKWKQLRLNIWGTGARSWLDAQQWDAGAERRRTFKKAKKNRKAKALDCFEAYEDADLKGWQCWGGLDLGLTTDPTALVLVFPDEELPAWEPTDDEQEAAEQAAERAALLDEIELWTVCRFWLPEQTAWRERNKVQWRQWAEQGWVKLTRGSEADFDQILRDIVELAEVHDLAALLFDPMFGSYLTQRLELEHGIGRVEFPQKITNYAEPCELFERFILRRQLHHNGSPIMRWMVGNVTVKEDDNGCKRPIKPKRGDPRRIDGVAAAIMGTAGAVRQPFARPTHYESNDPQWIQ